MNEEEKKDSEKESLQKKELIVDKEDEFYRGTKAKYLYYFAIVFVPVSAILMFSFLYGNESMDLTSFGGLGVSMSGAIFFIIKYRKMNNMDSAEDSIGEE